MCHTKILSLVFLHLLFSCIEISYFRDRVCHNDLTENYKEKLESTWTKLSTTMVKTMNYKTKDRQYKLYYINTAIAFVPRE